MLSWLWWLNQRALMKFLLIVTRREATGGNRIISDTVQPNFRPAYYYTLCALFHEIKIGKTEDLLLNIIFVLGTLGSSKLGPSPIWRQTGPHTFWCRGKLGPWKMLVRKIGPWQIGPRQIGSRQIGPQQIGHTWAKCE